MMPESVQLQPHSIFKQAVKCSDMDGILSAISGEDFDVNFRDVTHDLETPMMRLCHSCLSDEDLDLVLPVLVQKRPDVDLKDAIGRTLVMHACIALRHQIVDFSLALECDVTLCDRTGKNPFHYGAESGSDEIMEALLKHPNAVACLRVLDYKGYSAIDLARQRKHHSIVKMVSQTLSNNKGPSNTSFRPRPLQPAFMRNSNMERWPKEEQLNNSEVIQNQNSKVGSTHSSLSTTNSTEDKSLSPSERCEEMSDIPNGNDEEYYGDECDFGEDEEDKNNNTVQIPPELKPVRRDKTCTDKIECFTASAPVGLIKPRPLPRVTTRKQNYNPEPKEDPDDKDTVLNNIDENNDISSCDRQETDPTQSQVKAEKQKNLFVLRPAQGFTRRQQLPAMAEKGKNSSPTNKKSPRSPKEGPVNPQRGRNTISLSFTPTENVITIPTPRQLGPVVSPKRRQYTNEDNSRIDHSTNEANDVDMKKKVNFSLTSSSFKNKENVNKSQHLVGLGQKSENVNFSQRPKSFGQVKPTPNSMTTPRRRDLDAILSPSHKRLLNKRQQQEVDLGDTNARRKSQDIRDVNNKGGKEDNDSLFEEEIFLSTGIPTDSGSKEINGESGSKESQISNRRSSLSLPDLRDMTGCLVNSRKNSPHMGEENDDDYSTDENDDDCFESDDDDDDDDDDVDGDSDDSFNCDLGEDSVHPYYGSKSNKGEIPLPSIQITKDTTSYRPF